MFADWISTWRREPPAADSLSALPSPPDPAAVHSLADGVQQLCNICEDLLGVVARSEMSPTDVAQRLLLGIPERIEAVRACATEIKYQGTLCASSADDSYSLAALGQWVWNE